MKIAKLLLISSDSARKQQVQNIYTTTKLKCILYTFIIYFIIIYYFIYFFIIFVNRPPKEAICAFFHPC